MSYIFGKLWHSAIIWPIRKSFQCILQGVRFLLSNHTLVYFLEHLRMSHTYALQLLFSGWTFPLLLCAHPPIKNRLNGWLWITKGQAFRGKMFRQRDTFFLLTRNQSKDKLSGFGLPLRPAAPYISTHKVKHCHSLKCIMVWKFVASLASLFEIWPCSLARSCRRCWCRSAAREGEPRGRQSSCRTALQRCWPALCCAPRNKRLAGYLMWCYN